MKNETYIPRIVDAKLKLYLKLFGAVCVEGPKWCGKTWTSSYHSKSSVYLGDPTNGFQNRTLAEISPAILLEGAVPRLIDEWQEVPPLWDAVRYSVDQRGQPGQFILTGSATPNHKGILHSGAGRIAKLRMRTMSLYESNDSSGKVSLLSLFSNELSPCSTGDVSLERLAELVVRGGWPGALNVPIANAQKLPKEYLQAILDDDVFKVDGIARNLAKMRLLLRSLARNESTVATNTTLQRDLKGVDNETIDIASIADYLDILERLFIVENQAPFAPAVRSSVRVKQGSKRHFTDPSIACALLQLTPRRLMGNLETFGLLFEALCERDLRIYAETFDGALYHYQDYRNREIDAVIEHPDGRWGAFEIKLGANKIEEAAHNLKLIQREFENDPKGHPPSFLCVLCGLSTAAYQRPDGIYVVPITALRP